MAPPNRRSAMQGVGWGLRGLGGFVSGMTFGTIVARTGWSMSYMIFGSLMVIGCFATLFVKEPRDEQGKISLSDIKLSDVGKE
ncbi:MAG: hypothetical protein E4G98_01520, partial [Promethearchaeota archaeon]